MLDVDFCIKHWQAIKIQLIRHLLALKWIKEERLSSSFENDTSTVFLDTY